jgi:hypothetical protein
MRRERKKRDIAGAWGLKSYIDYISFGKPGQGQLAAKRYFVNKE